MRKPSSSRGERAVKRAIEALDRARDLLVQRLEDVDLQAVGNQGLQLVSSVRSDLERRVRPPRRRRVSPWSVASIGGLVVLGAALAGAGYVAYDRERRERARQRLNGVQSRARERYAELTAGRGQTEADLEARVREAIADGGPAPQGLQVVVEGRTVYLRGAVSDPAFVDAAAERAHGVSGVVAVVNLTTSASRDQAAQRS